MAEPGSESDFDRVVVPRLRDIEGWLTLDQARRLWDAVRRCPSPGQVVEIGSFRGRSTVVLALGAPPMVSVTAIDPHAGNDRGPQEINGFEQQARSDAEVFFDNLRAAGVTDRVRHVRAYSHDALEVVRDEPDVLFIDGAHRFGPARADVVDWGARVKPGGTMLIHDSFSSVGVTLAIVRELLAGRRFRYVGRSGSLAEYRADLAPGLGAVTRNAIRQAAQLPWFAWNLGLKIALSAGLGGVLRRIGRRVPEWPY